MKRQEVIKKRVNEPVEMTIYRFPLVGGTEAILGIPKNMTREQFNFLNDALIFYLDVFDKTLKEKEAGQQTSEQ